MLRKPIIWMPICILGLLGLLGLIVFGDNGLLDLQRLRHEKTRLEGQNRQITQKNLSLYEEINRLKDDPHYIENVARQDLGMIGKEDVILRSNQGASVTKPKQRAK